MALVAREMAVVLRDMAVAVVTVARAVVVAVARVVREMAGGVRDDGRRVGFRHDSPVGRSANSQNRSLRVRIGETQQALQASNGPASATPCPKPEAIFGTANARLPPLRCRAGP